MGTTTMEDLFHSYWWLIFPIWGIAMGSWHSFAHYRRQKGMLDLIRTYAQKGEQPPEALLAALTADEDGNQPGYRSPAHYWSLFGLFLVLAVGFGVGGYAYDFEGVGWPFCVVGRVIGGVANRALINALLYGRQPRS